MVATTDPLPSPPETPPQTVSKPLSESCEQWLVNAQVTEKSAARELIRRESNCNPRAVNKSSGACGVAQAWPCSKMPCELGDGQCQVNWMKDYVAKRYTTWESALRFHDIHNYY